MSSQILIQYNTYLIIHEVSGNTCRYLLSTYHYKMNNSITNTVRFRSAHPDCRSGTNEVYRTTSRTLPISVGQETDQTQLMIKRVLLLRKLSEVSSAFTAGVQYFGTRASICRGRLS